MAAPHRTGRGTGALDNRGVDVLERPNPTLTYVPFEGFVQAKRFMSIP